MSSGLEKLLECGKCKQKYNTSAHRPKLLVCHHCFCLQCVQTFIKNKANQTATCPTCSKVTCVGRNGVGTLPDNEFLLPQIEFLSIAVNKKNKQHKSPSPPIEEEEEESDDNIFVSDESVDENSDDDKFISDEDDVDVHFTNGLPNGEPAEVRIFCQTCMSLATQPCLSVHQICNYEQGVKWLQERLVAAVKHAEENLVQEVHHLEDSSEFLGRVHAAWTAIANELDDSCINQTVYLSTTRSLLETLPDSKLGTECAKFGDPSTLANAVKNTEDILNNSAAKSAQCTKEANIWRSISICKINLQSNDPSSFGPEGLNFHLELHDKSKEDTVCVLYGISKLLEEKAKYQITQHPIQIKEEQEEEQNQEEEEIVNQNSPPQQQKQQHNEKIREKPPFSSKSSSNSSSIKSSSSNNSTTKSPTNTKLNGTNSNEWIEVQDKNDIVTKKVSKPMTSGCAYCFFDLLQGHTELGRIIMEINCKAAPKMSKNFIELCTGIHGFGYLNSKLWKISSGDHVDGGDIPEGGQCSIFDKKPFLGDASTLQDGLGMLRMRGRGTSEDGQPIVGSQFMIWIKNRKFKNYTRTLVFGIVTDGINILTDMPETRQRKGKPFIPPVTIIKCGIME